MTAYAFWNNKGGVGKSFLSFVAATEYAHTYPGTDVYVIDLCPQANISETLLVNSDRVYFQNLGTLFNLSYNESKPHRFLKFSIPRLNLAKLYRLLPIDTKILNVK